ncbi:MAG: iron-containing redox enzyme family protein [Streptosporangiales bacterium]|nr:iron-containing redox enzyme family protein [Streptosporangiales bacterium]
MPRVTVRCGRRRAERPGHPAAGRTRHVSREGGPLPRARGPLSGAVLDALRGVPGHTSFADIPVPTDAYGDDVQLTLYLSYELSYRGFDDVDPEWEWDAGLLGLRGALERRFLRALREDAPRHDDVASALDELLVEPIDAAGVSHFLRDDGEWWHMREYAAHRSIYHLKEADPYAWVIPRIDGQAKAALVAVEYDEFGGGRGERVHSRLFADLMDGMGLDHTYGGYLDTAPAQMLAIVNVISLFGLHRSLRGALVGHFATVEITSGPAARRLVQALERLAAHPACLHYYTEHIEADAVHEQVLRHDVIADLVRHEPHLASDVVFGIGAATLTEDRFADYTLTAWRAGRTSMRETLPAP